MIDGGIHEAIIESLERDGTLVLDVGLNVSTFLTPPSVLGGALRE